MARARLKAKAKAIRDKESRVCHECNKPGHLIEDSCVYKKRMAEKGNKDKVETSDAVQGAMVETCEYTEDDYVFVFGEAVIASIQRRTFALTVVDLDQRVRLVTRPMCQQKAQHHHCFRLMDLQLSSVGSKKSAVGET